MIIIFVANKFCDTMVTNLCQNHKANYKIILLELKYKHEK